MLGLVSINEKNIVYDMTYYIDIYEIIMFVAAILCSVPIFKNILQPKSTFKNICLNIWLLMLFILSVSAIAMNTYNPFIYFRF